MLKKNLIIRLLQQFLLFCITLSIARFTGPVGNGIFSLFITDVSFFILLIGFCVDSTIVFFGAKGKINLSWIISMLFPLLLVQCSLFIGAVFIARFCFQYSIFKIGIHEGGTVWAFAYIFSSILYNYFSAFLLAKKIFFKISLYNVLSQLVLLSWIVIEKKTGMASNPFFKIENLIPLYTCLYIINALVVIVLAFKGNTEKLVLKNPFKIMDRQMLRYTGFAFIGNTLQFFAFRLDIWLMDHYHSKYELGIYALSSKMAQLWWLIPQLMATLLFPLTALEHQSVSEKKFLAIVIRSTVFSIATAIVAIFVFPFFIDFTAGPLYGASYYPFLLLMPGVILLSINILLAARLAGKGNVMINMQGSMLCFVLVLLLDFWLIPQKGAIGAAIASTIAYSCSTLFTIIKYLKWRKS